MIGGGCWINNDRFLKSLAGG